jgi:hypothetical protein
MHVFMTAALSASGMGPSVDFRRSPSIKLKNSITSHFSKKRNKSTPSPGNARRPQETRVPRKRVIEPQGGI